MTIADFVARNRRGLLALPVALLALLGAGSSSLFLWHRSIDNVVAVSPSADGWAKLSADFADVDPQAPTPTEGPKPVIEWTETYAVRVVSLRSVTTQRDFTTGMTIPKVTTPAGTRLWELVLEWDWAKDSTPFCYPELLDGDGTAYGPSSQLYGSASDRAGSLRAEPFEPCPGAARGSLTYAANERAGRPNPIPTSTLGVGTARDRLAYAVYFVIPKAVVPDRIRVNVRAPQFAEFRVTP